MTLWIVIGFAALLFVIFVVFANKKMIKISEPSIGFLNLIGEAASDFVREDRDALRGSFYSVAESSGDVPTCDVLLIYARINSDGSLVATKSELREIVADSGARIVIVATDNPADAYTTALRSKGSKANLVLTLERRGWKFASFLKRLFEKMETGLSMPVAWVRLAPQKSGDPHDDCPSTIFSCELGPVVFKRDVASSLWSK